MAVFRIEKTKNYTVMSNHHFKNHKMSLKAKGLLSMMLSLPPEWDYSIAGLITLSKDGETSVRSGLKELEEFGYLQINKIYPDKSKTGRIEYVYNIYEEPQLLKQEGEKQGVENQGVEILYVENQGQLNTKELNTNNKIKNNKRDKKIANQENPISIIKSKTKPNKRMENIVTMKGMVNVFSNNEKVKEKLLEYFDIRVKKGLQPNQWKIILEDLRNFAGENANLAIDRINNSIAGGYMQIIPSWEKDKMNNRNIYGKPSFDNTVGTKPKAVINMNKEERQQFEDNLARDDDGNLICF